MRVIHQKLFHEGLGDRTSLKMTQGIHPEFGMVSADTTSFRIEVLFESGRLMYHGGIFGPFFLRPMCFDLGLLTMLILYAWDGGWSQVVESASA